MCEKKHTTRLVSSPRSMWSKCLLSCKFFMRRTRRDRITVCYTCEESVVSLENTKTYVHLLSSQLSLLCAAECDAHVIQTATKKWNNLHQNSLHHLQTKDFLLLLLVSSLGSWRDFLVFLIKCLSILNVSFRVSLNFDISAYSQFHWFSCTRNWTAFSTCDCPGFMGEASGQCTRLKYTENYIADVWMIFNHLI